MKGENKRPPMKVAVVITTTRGRESNLDLVLRSLVASSRRPDGLVVIEDGWVGASDGDTTMNLVLDAGLEAVCWVGNVKHVPGREQPRNVGVRVAVERMPDTTHVWFVDSDVIVAERALEALEIADAELPDPTILVGPYDWLPDTARQADPGLRNDPRWPMFEQRHSETIRGDLSAGLGCFSGNLVWPVSEFQRVGGFWNEIHHGRCEDGELGLRAVAMDVPIALVPDARGWHLAHPVNTPLALERNARDVPMLNERHPWVERGAVFMVDRDGKAFDVNCGVCGETVPTIAWWQHAADRAHSMELRVEPAA